MQQLNGPFEYLSAVALSMACMNIPSGKNGLPSIRAIPRRSMRTPFVSGFAVRVNASDFSATFLPAPSKRRKTISLLPSGRAATSTTADTSLGFWGSGTASTSLFPPDASGISKQPRSPFPAISSFDKIGRAHV